jgi:hypothetical protein
MSIDVFIVSSIRAPRLLGTEPSYYLSFACASSTFDR